ncbi:hypothetical protein BDW02DRAFT_414949 [Decorospora gaudefroyi]|uniref:Uncharacterized protein n=1 Tax=Decorospora gaudefroyi TaxID=184978 RepID=A0A6A5KV61_9PLEO|nr:hypothetical protein BDW02DRAFT_414949 [Decorospora gaudefroyi]
MASAQHLQPYCEDVSDDSDGPVSFQGRKSPNAANQSTKRSHPSDVDKEAEKPPAQESVPNNIDLRSDSGYSSYTAATVSSTNSAPSATAHCSPPVVPATAAPVPAQSPAPKTRRPAQSEPRQNSTNSSPRPKPLSRTASQSSKPSATHRRSTVSQQDRPDRRVRRDSRVDAGECTDPTCTTCGPNALPQQRRRPDIQPSQSARDVTRISSDQRSMRSDPAAYYTSPPSPTHVRQAAYLQGPAILQPSAPRRRSSSTSRQQRPMSYGGEPGPQYWVPGMPAPYPSPPQEHGPPPSSSASWRNSMQQYPPMASMGHMAPPMAPYMGPQTQTSAYPPYAFNSQTSSPYDGPQRPVMSSRNSSNFARNGPPVITQTQAPREQQYSARYGQPRIPAQLQLQDEAYQSESDSESESEEERGYDELDPRDPRAQRALMPPPKMTRTKSTSKKQRPPMRHANTTQVVDVDRVARRLSQVVVDDRPGRELTQRVTNEPSRRMSVSRPAPPQRKTQSDYVTPRARVVVNNSAKTDRRRSAQVYDKSYEDFVHAKEVQERARVKAEAKALKEADARAKAHAKAQKAHEDRYQAEQAQREKERKRQSRSEKVYYQPPPEFNDSEEEEEEEEEEDSEEDEIPIPAPAPPRRRRHTEVEQPKIKRIENAAEDYISAQRGAQNPYNDQIHRAAKKASRVPSVPSHSGSSGSDKQSQSNRTVMTSNGNGEVRLRVDASAPLSLSFNGDTECRTLRMIPAGNGMADIVIGSRNGESTYQGSERGSVAGDRRSLASNARRQAEETTETSSRSSRRRDDRVVQDSWDDQESRRPLRRRAPSYRN